MRRDACSARDGMKPDNRVGLVGEENHFSISPRFEPLESAQINHQLVHADRSDDGNRSVTVTHGNQNHVWISRINDCPRVPVGVAHGNQSHGRWLGSLPLRSIAHRRTDLKLANLNQLTAPRDCTAGQTRWRCWSR